MLKKLKSFLKIINEWRNLPIKPPRSSERRTFYIELDRDLTVHELSEIAKTLNATRPLSGAGYERLDETTRKIFVEK